MLCAVLSLWRSDTHRIEYCMATSRMAPFNRDFTMSVYAASVLKPTPDPADEAPEPERDGVWQWLWRTAPTAVVVATLVGLAVWGQASRVVDPEVLGALRRQGRSGDRLVRRAQRAGVDVRRVQSEAACAADRITVGARCMV